MFKILDADGVITRIVSEQVGDDYHDDYSECEIVFSTGLAMRAYIPVSGIDISEKNAVRGKGYYASGVCDYHGMPEMGQMFFFTDWQFYQAAEEWHGQSA